MSYYWFNRQELLQKAKDRYHNGGGKDIAAEYYIANKDVLKEKVKTYRNKIQKYRNLPEQEKEVKREYSQNRYKNKKENTN